MNDGHDIAAKLQNSNAGSQLFTTASEVATMDFCMALFLCSTPDSGRPAMDPASSRKFPNWESRHIFPDWEDARPEFNLVRLG